MPDWSTIVASLGTSFTPNSEPGLVAWYDASDGANVTTIATFTFDSINSATLTLQCKNNIMPAKILYDANPGGGGDRFENGNIYIFDISVPDIDSVATQINAMSGYTAVVLTFGSDLIATDSSHGDETVVTWHDKSASGFDVTQATAANRPLYASVTQNGLNTITFDGTNDWMTGGDVLDFDARTEPFTMVAVYKLTAINPSTTRTIYSKLDATTPFAGWELRIAGAVASDPMDFIINTQSTDSILVRWPRVNDTLFHKDILTYDGSDAAEGMQAYVAGVEQTMTIVANSTPGDTTTAISFTIGDIDEGTGTNRALPGSLAEIIIYNRKLSGESIVNLNNYLSRWGV